MNRALYFACLASMMAIVFPVVPTGVLHAQSEPLAEIIYGVMAEEACDPLVRSSEAMADLTSAESRYTLVADLSGLPLLSVEGGTVGYRQMSSFAVDPEALARIKALREMDAVDLAALAEDAQSYTDLVMGLVRGTDLAQTVSIDLSDEIRSYLAQELGSDLALDLTFQYALVDGILYVDTSKVADLVPALGFLDGWIGFDLPSALLLTAEDGLLPQALIVQLMGAMQ